MKYISDKKNSEMQYSIGELGINSLESNSVKKLLGNAVYVSQGFDPSFKQDQKEYSTSMWKMDKRLKGLRGIERKLRYQIEQNGISSHDARVVSNVLNQFDLDMGTNKTVVRNTEMANGVGTSTPYSTKIVDNHRKFQQTNVGLKGLVESKGKELRIYEAENRSWTDKAAVVGDYATKIAACFLVGAVPFVNSCSKHTEPESDPIGGKRDQTEAVAKSNTSTTSEVSTTTSTTGDGDDPNQPKYITHEVAEGETLEKIAGKYLISEDILRANNTDYDKTNQPTAGTIVNIPYDDSDDSTASEKPKGIFIPGDNIPKPGKEAIDAFKKAGIIDDPKGDETPEGYQGKTPADDDTQTPAGDQGKTPEGDQTPAADADPASTNLIYQSSSISAGAGYDSSSENGGSLETKANVFYSTPNDNTVFAEAELSGSDKATAGLTGGYRWVSGTNGVVEKGVNAGLDTDGDGVIPRIGGELFDITLGSLSNSVTFDIYANLYSGEDDVGFNVEAGAKLWEGKLPGTEKNSRLNAFVGYYDMFDAQGFSASLESVTDLNEDWDLTLGPEYESSVIDAAGEERDNFGVFAKLVKWFGPGKKPAKHRSSRHLNPYRMNRAMTGSGVLPEYDDGNMVDTSVAPGWNGGTDEAGEQILPGSPEFGNPNQPDIRSDNTATDAETPLDVDAQVGDSDNDYDDETTSDGSSSTGDQTDGDDPFN